MINFRADNYSGLWAVEPTHMTQLLGQLDRDWLQVHVQANQDMKTADVSGPFARAGTDGSVAVIRCEGVLTKAGTSLGDGSMVEARRAIRNADNDASVRATVLVCDSPGGTVAGTLDLALDVKNFSKPIVAYVEDLAASAMYWVASQADAIYVNNDTALVGSVGVFMVLYDVSKAFEEEGVRTVLIKGGEFKGIGIEGTEITNDQEARLKKLVDDRYAQFISGVATGRNMQESYVREVIATGELFTVTTATALKLIDGVKPFDDVVAQLLAGSDERTVEMTTTSKNDAASFDQIVAACPGLDPTTPEGAKLCAEMQAGRLTAEESTEWYCNHLREQVDQQATAITKLEDEKQTLSARVKELETAAAEAAAKSGSAQTVGTETAGDGDGGSAVDEFAAKVDEIQTKQKCTRAQATRIAGAKFPELREAAVAAVN